MRSRWIPIALFAALLFVTYIYLYPGSKALFRGSSDTVMSDGSDAASLPYAYDMLIQIWKEHPSRLLYGAVYSDYGDPLHGSAMWMPWNERWLVVLSSYFAPLEQLSTAFIGALFLLNALCMYALTRYLGWERTLASGLAIAWAFCAYTRARAKVHGALVGIYHLPLIFLGLYLVARGKGLRSLGLAIAAFLLVGTVAHYYILTCIFLSPFFLVFLAFQPEFHENWKRVSLRLVAAVAPLLIFLGLSFIFALPPEARVTTAHTMLEPEVKAGEEHPYLIFLRTYAARPLDYLGGDISLKVNSFELNPLRGLANREIVRDMGLGNAHEHTNGIRWSILALAICAAVALAKGRYRGDSFIKSNMIFFYIFGCFAFWMSLGPDVPLSGFNPSAWLFAITAKIRVPSRAGIAFHFSLLMIAGFYLTKMVRWKRFLPLFPLLMVLDYPPLVAMPMANISPRYMALQREVGKCGPGMAFPFFSPFYLMTTSYVFSQRMRGSDCMILNNMTDVEHSRWMTNLFPPTDEYLRSLTQRSEPAIILERIARCVPLNWIAFHEAAPRSWIISTCKDLGWHLNDDLTCVAPQMDRALEKLPEQCF